MEKWDKKDRLIDLDGRGGAVHCMMGIGGLDPSGGAGLPADTRAAAAFGVHLCGVTTAVIAQNTRGVQAIEPVSPVMLRAQLTNLLNDVRPQSVKIGMLPSVEAVEIVAEALRSLPPLPIVLDTVFAPSSGLTFSGDDTIAAIVEHLFPLCELVTPNRGETARLCAIDAIAAESAEQAAQLIGSLGPRHVLIKGGHAPDDAFEVADWLWDGELLMELCAPRVRGYEVRGTGCLLATALAAQLGQGVEIHTATANAKEWLTEQIWRAEPIGGGRRIAAAVKGREL